VNAITSSGTESFSINENGLREFVPGMTNNDDIESHLLTHSKLEVSTINPSSKVITKIKYQDDN
jgi:hypothetical protein